jgi:hypothetical protein
MKRKSKSLPIPDEVNAFKDAVNSTDEIKNGYCSGLQAMKGYSKYIKLKDSKKCKGSVDIDNCVRMLYPQSSRWDYVVAYETKVYYVEIHPAGTSGVDEVIKKSDWLRNWLKTSAPALKKLISGNNLYWIPSGRYDILPNSNYKKKLSQKGIEVKSTPMIIP